VARRRAPLVHTRAALARGELTVGFLGGSITAPQTGTRWPGPFAAWLAGSFPGVRVTIANAALGATGSDLAVFRVQTEIIARGCDLVFVEYAVNDFDQPTVRRNRTREGLLRQLAAAACDIVLVHTFRAEVLPEMESGRVPASIAEFEILAAHYGLTSVWMGLHALREVRAGLMTMAEWLPDDLHPEQRGSLSYAQSVIAALAPEFSARDPAPGQRHRRALPAPLTTGAWEHVGFVPFSDVVRQGPWTLGPWTACPGMTEALRSTAPGAGLQCEFAGRGLVLGFDFGRASGEVRHRVDQGEWHETRRDRPDWVGEHGWFRPEVVTDDLPSGRHTFELQTLNLPAHGDRGSHTILGFLGVIR
jgi:lysophospholipase L1-like esterase